MLKCLSINLKRGDSIFNFEYFVGFEESHWIVLNNIYEFNKTLKLAFEDRKENYALQIGDIIFFPDKFLLGPFGVKRISLQLIIT